MNTKVIENQNLTKVHNQDNQFILQDTSSGKTNKSIVNNNKRAKTTNSSRNKNNKSTQKQFSK